MRAHHATSPALGQTRRYQMRAMVKSMATVDDSRLREILTGSPTIAVLGIHRDRHKAAFYVPEYLHDEGYRVLGVNPKLVGESLFGNPVKATLAELGEPVDLVD